MRINDWSSDVVSSDLLATFFLSGKHFAHHWQREEVREDQAEHPALHHLAQHVAAQIAQLGLVDHLEAAVDIGLLTAVAGGDADLAVHQQVGLFQLLDEHARSDEHTSELQSLMRTSSALFFL